MNIIFKIVKKLPFGLLTFIGLGVVTYLTLFYVPKPEDVPSAFAFEGADKVVHLIMFFLCESCLMLDFFCRLKPDTSGEKRKRLALALIISGIVFAGMTELAQHYMGIGREWELADFVADTVGIILAWPFTRLVCRS